MTNARTLEKALADWKTDGGHRLFDIHSKCCALQADGSPVPMLPCVVFSVNKQVECDTQFNAVDLAQKVIIVDFKDP